jgi:hypothetical protein
MNESPDSAADLGSRRDSEYEDVHYHDYDYIDPNLGEDGRPGTSPRRAGGNRRAVRYRGGITRIKHPCASTQSRRR